MKKIFYYMVAGAFVLAGCNQEVLMNESTGSLSVDLSCKTEYHESNVQTKAPQNDDEIINNLTIDIERPADGWKKQYKPFSTIKGTIIDLGSGAYTLKASSPVQEAAAFEQPIYEGSTQFSILTGQVTQASVIAKITNMKVTVNLSEDFYKELSDFTVTVSNGPGNLTWEKNPTSDDFVRKDGTGATAYTSKKAGFYTVSKLTIQVTGHRAIDNSTATTTFYIDNVAAAQHHILNLNAKVTGQLGGITITLDHTVKDVTTNIVVPGFEDVPVPGDPKPDRPVEPQPQPEPEVPATTPTVTWDANPEFAPMNINEQMIADLVIEGKEGIREFKVIVESAALAPAIEGLTQDGTATMDLINDEGLIAFLAEAAPTLPTGKALQVATPIDFKLTGLIKMINIYEPSAGDQHHFTLNVTDAKGQVLTKKLTFVSEAPKA